MPSLIFIPYLWILFIAYAVVDGVKQVARNSGKAKVKSVRNG
jgi:hypothetical protein